MSDGNRYLGSIVKRSWFGIEGAVVLGLLYAAPTLGGINDPIAGLDDWPVEAVRRWVGYEQVPVISLNPPSKQTEAPPTRRESSEVIDAHRFLGNLVRKRVSGILERLRPDLVAVADQMKPFDTQTLGLIGVESGNREDLPFVRMKFAIEATDLRPLHVEIYAAKRGDEPGSGRKQQWRSYAQRTVVELFGPQPHPLVERRTPGGFYFDWIPRWRHQPMPAAFRTRFGVLLGVDHVNLVWSAPHRVEEVRAARVKLNGYSVDHGYQPAVMLVVKNALAARPDIVRPMANVRAQCVVLESGTLRPRLLRFLHLDRLAIDQQVIHGPLVWLWQIRIESRQGDLPPVWGWVDPASRRLLCLAVATQESKWTTIDEKN